MKKKHNLETLLLNCSDQLFLIDDETGEQYTYKMLFESACAIAGFLIDQGLGKGDRLIIMADNSIFLAKIYFACLYAGITVIPVNPDWTKEQIDFVSMNSDSQFLLTTFKYSKNIPKKITPIVINIEMSDGNHISCDSMENYPKINPLDNLCESNIAVIIYTSGTTSQPKGVIHTVSDLVGNGTLFVNTMNITEKNKFYNILPMTYLGGYYNLLLIPYLAKASVVISSAFNAQTVLHFWTNVMKHQVNTLWLVPTLMAILLEIDRNKLSKQYSKENISLAMVGTAPLSTKLKNTFEDTYGIRVLENYGLSETLFISTNLPLSDSKGVGKLMKGVLLKIVDSQGESLPPGLAGEIVVSTPYVMNTYLGLDTIFNKKNDEWFYTGDIGHLDNENNLHITDRKKDLIIKGGVNISPAAIEEMIYLHPSIQECAVVGIPHALSGEEIIVVVKISENTNFHDIKAQLMEICKQSLSIVQQPSDIVKLDELPHTYTGKIQKSKLRAWLIEDKNNSQKREAKDNKKETNFFKASHIVTNAIPALSIAYNNMVYELQNKNVDITVLSLGEAFFDLPFFDFSKLPFPASYHYSHSRGIPKLRQILSNYFQDQYDVRFNPDREIILTAGSKIAIYMALMAVINPGDEVIIHDPSWVSYPEQIRLCHGIPISVPYYESVYDFEKYITNRTKLLIINNPNNPKGSLLTLDEIAYLYKLAEKYNLYILSDEAYSDFVLNKEQFISIGNFDKELKFSIICNSISKNFGISGWRIGYVITNQFLTEQILKLNQHLITCPSTILEYYIADHFYEILSATKPQIVALLEKKQRIIEYIKKIGLYCLEGNATFYIFLSIAESSLDSDKFCQLLLEKYQVCVVPGIGYGKSCDQFIRVSIGAESEERVFSALNKIKNLIHNTSRHDTLNVSQDIVNTIPA